MASRKCGRILPYVGQQDVRGKWDKTLPGIPKKRESVRRRSSLDVGRHWRLAACSRHWVSR
jgi:hypothetical protein